MGKSALITGITGQDGTYLAELLLEKGYTVHGLARRNSQMTLGTLEKLPKETLKKINIIYGDVTDSQSVDYAFREAKPDEIYHLASQSFVGLSWTNPKLTFNVNNNGTLNMLSVFKNLAPDARFYFAGSSEQFGNVQETPQTEKTPFYPRSPYGITKVAGYWLSKNYRESYNLFCSNGLLFNHESPRRGLEFVTRKITYNAARIKLGLQNQLALGNLDAKRDWGYSKDYVDAMWRMLQHEKPDDFVVATGEQHSVREFVEAAFSKLGLNYKDHVVIDKKYFRPAEVNNLLGDYSKAKEILGWEPKVRFHELAEMMVEEDLKYVKSLQNKQ